MTNQSQIFVIDDLHPEDNAMLQALYSRSPNSVMQHLDKVKGADSGSFMEKFYVGYGHKSIADCGTTTIFIENVSMLAAKAIQDWPLYNGQEASTRYLDFSKQEILNPAESAEGAKIQSKWLQFYTESKPQLLEHLKGLFPIEQGQDQKVYERAINAKSFDILRGFLPAGSTTFLSWHTNLRQAYEKLQLLEFHPLAEIRTLANQILQTLQNKYKNSFSFKKYPEQQAYLANSVANYTYHSVSNDFPDFAASNNFAADQLQTFQDLLATRPIKTNLPLFLGKYGQINFRYKLDFGSFRDIQRHRNGECLMPILSSQFGFYPWYLEQLPDQLRAEAQELIQIQERAINNLPLTDFEKQYYFPMGYTIPVDITYRLPAAVYVAELRSDTTVHPTLRYRAQQMAAALEKSLPSLKIHHNLAVSDWDIRRGKQDITQK